jgi:hypothetical protein
VSDQPATDDLSDLPPEAKRAAVRFVRWLRYVYHERHFGRFEAVSGSALGGKARVKVIHVTRTVIEEDF